MGSRPSLLVADHEMLKTIMVKDFASFQNVPVRLCTVMVECEIFICMHRSQIKISQKLNFCCFNFCCGAMYLM